MNRYRENLIKKLRSTHHDLCNDAADEMELMQQAIDALASSFGIIDETHEELLRKELKERNNGRPS